MVCTLSTVIGTGAGGIDEIWAKPILTPIFKIRLSWASTGSLAKVQFWEIKHGNHAKNKANAEKASRPYELPWSVGPAIEEVVKLDRAFLPFFHLRQFFA